MRKVHSADTGQQQPTDLHVTDVIVERRPSFLMTSVTFSDPQIRSGAWHDDCAVSNRLLLLPPSEIIKKQTFFWFISSPKCYEKTRAYNPVVYKLSYNIYWRKYIVYYKESFYFVGLLFSIHKWLCLSPTRKKNPTNLFLEAVFPLLTNNSNADIVYVCVCHHFCAALCGQGKRENTCSSSGGNGGPDARGPCSFLYSRRGRLFSLSLSYIVASRLQRERERN